MSLSVIIVLYNGIKYIGKCLQALEKVGLIENVIVVDNASTDTSLEIVKSFKCKIIPLTKNVGFGQANNVGIAYALNHFDSNHIMLLNQDAYIQEHAVDHFEKLPRRITDSVVGFLQLNADSTALDSMFAKHYLSPSSCPKFLEDSYFNNIKSFYEIEFVNAAAWVMPRRILKKIGGFSPTFFHYGEDLNYVHRLRYHGEKIYLAAHCAVQHDREMRSGREFDKTPFHVQIRNLVEMANPLNNKNAFIYSFRRLIFLILVRQRGLKLHLKTILKLALQSGRSIEKIRRLTKTEEEFLFLPLTSAEVKRLKTQGFSNRDENCG